MAPCSAATAVGHPPPLRNSTRARSSRHRCSSSSAASGPKGLARPARCACTSESAAATQSACTSIDADDCKPGSARCLSVFAACPSVSPSLALALALPPPPSLSLPLLPACAIGLAAMAMSATSTDESSTPSFTRSSATRVLCAPARTSPARHSSLPASASFFRMLAYSCSISRASTRGARCCHTTSAASAAISSAQRATAPCCAISAQ
mmetsp:Transcript_6041/g.18155  ORF Transcript_6041/g.18155 Transcript_6041/m.18155 type:complete len:209 (-) Transcript_6041:215-841(-)